MLPRLRARLVLPGRPDHLRDHVSRALHDDHVADSDVLAANVVLVVQRRAGDRDASDLDRLELGQRVEHAGATHADVDCEQSGGRRSRRPLVRAGEPRSSVQGAESLLLREGVDLDHDPVDLVPELAPPGLPRRTGLGHLFDRLQSLGVRVRAEPEAVQPGERLPLRGGGGAAVDADPVHVDRQRPLRGHGRVELAQRARGCVSCIRRRLAPSRDLRLVEAVEAGEREVDLAAHLENLAGGRSLFSPVAAAAARMPACGGSRSRPRPGARPRASLRARRRRSRRRARRPSRRSSARARTPPLRRSRAACECRLPTSRAPRPSSPSPATPSETGARPCGTLPPAGLRRAASVSRE